MPIDPCNFGYQSGKASKPIFWIQSSLSFWNLVQVTLKTSKLDRQLPWALPFWLCQPSLATLNHNWPAGGTNNAASAHLGLSLRITIDNGTARLRHIRIVCPRVLMSFQDFTPFDSTFNTFYETGDINAVYDCIALDVAPNVTGICHGIWCTYDMMRGKEYIELEILRVSQIETFHRGRSWW